MPFPQFFQDLIFFDEKDLLKYLEKFNHTKVAEISDSRKKYFDLVCKYIKKNSGICITIDYGYKNLPNNFTLQSIYS